MIMLEPEVAGCSTDKMKPLNKAFRKLSVESLFRFRPAPNLYGVLRSIIMLMFNKPGLKTEYQYRSQHSVRGHS